MLRSSLEYLILIFHSAATVVEIAPEGISGGLHNNSNITDLTGELNDSRFIISRGDSRIAITLPRDSETIRLNRESRFLVDDYGSPTVLAYRLTKPFKLSDANFNRGVFTFVLAECAVEETDNLELHIPNYYKHFPRDGEDGCEHKSEFRGDYSEPEEDFVTDHEPGTFFPDDAPVKPEPPERKVWI